jgi:hypothetical protein
VQYKTKPASTLTAMEVAFANMLGWALIGLVVGLVRAATGW